MLNVVSSGKFVLTLQSIPPFFIESIIVLVLAVLLAVPLIVHVQYLLGKPLQVNMKTLSPFNFWYESEKNGSRIVMHYPSPKFPESTSSLSLNLGVESARKTFSTPILQNNDPLDNSNHHTNEPREPRLKCLEIKPSKTLPLQHSSSFVVTNSEVPVIDISSFNYNAYRHKLIEAILRKRYDDYQPPGDVILNSIHLNTINSTVDFKLDNRYNDSFFDFIEGQHDPTQRLSRKEMEFLHPLDHFLVKGSQKPPTMEKAIETMFIVEENKDIEDYDEFRDQLPPPSINVQHFRKYYNIDKSANSSNVTVKLASGVPSLESSKLVCKTGSNTSRSISSQKRKNQSFTNSDMITLSEKRRPTKPSSIRSSVDSLNSRNLTISKKQTKSPALTDSTRYDEKESTAFCTSFSSSENESAFSDSSKAFDKSRPRSCDEVLTSKSQSSTSRKLKPTPIGTLSNPFYNKSNNVSKQNSDTLDKKQSITRDPTPLNVNEVSCRPKSANSPLLSRGNKKSKIIKGNNDKTPVGSARNSQAFTDKLTKKSTSKSQALQDKVGLKINETISKIPCPSIEITTQRTVSARALSTYQRLKDDNNLNGVEQRPKTVSGIVSKVPVATTSLQSRNRLKLLANSIQKPTVREDKKQSKKSTVSNPESSASSASKNVDKPFSSRGNDEQFLKRKSDRKSEDTITLSRSSIRRQSSKCWSKLINSVERCKIAENKRVKDKEENNDLGIDLKLPQRGTKISLAMQNGLKNYMQKLKEVTLNQSEKDITRLVSLSLTEAILPDLKSVLSDNELQQLTDLLNRAEIKSQREATKSQSPCLI